MSGYDKEERRQHERKTFSQTRDGVSFSVRADDTVCAILSVHDASVSGIRLGLKESFQVGQNLVFVVRDEDFDLQIKGEIRWTNPLADTTGQEFGIEFDVNDMDNNILFFMSLRKYLDGFDDVPEKEL